MRRVLTLAVCLLALSVVPARATPYTMTFDGVTMNDGGTWTGWIEFNNGEVEWNVVSSGGNTPGLPDFTYTPSTSSIFFGQPHWFMLIGPASPDFDFRSRILLVALNSPPFYDTIDLGLGTGGSRECFQCNPYRVALGGRLLLAGDIAQYHALVVNPSPVPEPATGLLLLVGLGAAGLKRKFATRSTVFHVSP